MTELGRLEKLDLRDIWPHEAYQLTPWLLENSDVISEALGIDLELSVAEHPVGSFSLDLLGRDLTNDCVLIVENQLTPTDHDHLGKLVTYAAGTDAGTVIWLAPRFREEHRQALDLLNDLGGDRVRFFGIELSAVRIGGSKPAPMVQIRAQPNDWHAHVSASARATQASGKAAIYRQFWTRFLERVAVEHPTWTNASKPQTASWLSMPCPFKGGSGYVSSFAQGGKVRVELYIDSPQGETADAIYGMLHERARDLETVFGGALVFEELPDRRASRIAVYRDGDVSETTLHDEYIDWMFDTGERLRRAIESLSDEVLAELTSDG